MADPEETTGTVSETEAPAEGDGDNRIEAIRKLVEANMAQLASVDEALGHNTEWMGAMEARIEAVEQQIASQLALGQDYSRLDAMVSGLQAMVEAHHIRPHPINARPDSEAEVPGPVNTYGVEGSLGTLASGRVVYIDGAAYVVVGPAGEEGKIKLRGPGGLSRYMPSTYVPDKVVSE